MRGILPQKTDACGKKSWRETNYEKYLAKTSGILRNSNDCFGAVPCGGRDPL